MDAQERRRFERRLLDEDVLAYLDGDRLDAQTGNISAGGLFLRTSRPAEFPIGQVVALVFRDPVPPGGNVFLVARVVRHQAGPEVGVGLQWDRAVTMGAADPVRRVLRRLFGFTDPVLEVRELPERAGRQYTHRFPRQDDWPAARKTVVLPRPGAAPNDPGLPLAAIAAEAPDPGPPPPSAGAVPELEHAVAAAVLELEGYPGSAAPPAPPAPPPPAPPSVARPVPPAASPAPSAGPRAATVAMRRPAPAESPPAPAVSTFRPRGPITAQVDAQGNRQGMDLPAALEHGGVSVPARLRWMGLGIAGVESAWAPTDPDAELVLRFHIPTREGPANLQCLVRVRSTDPGRGGRLPCLEVTLGRVDEGDHRGVLVKYLRWLAQRQQSGEAAGG